MTAKIINKKAVLSATVINQGEKGSDNIVFTLNKNYNGKDLSSYNPFASVKRADGTTDKISLTLSSEQSESNSVGNGKPSSTDEISLILNVGESITAVPGELEMQLSFESTDGEVVWRTEKFGLEILGSIDAYKDYSDRAPDAVTKLHNQMIAYVSKMAALVDEVNEKIANLPSGGGASYDENNKLNADYVSGLSTVAKTGSYADLSDKPELGAYLTSQQLALELNNLKQSIKPAIFKYCDPNYDDETYDANNNYNINLISCYLPDELNAGNVLLHDTVLNRYYTCIYSSKTDNELTFFFYDGLNTKQLQYLFSFSDFNYS